VFPAGCIRTSLEGVAEDIRAVGGSADVAVVDALDPGAVEAHLDALVASTGKTDISMNATSLRGDLQGSPLRQMIVDDLTSPALTVLRSQLLHQYRCRTWDDRGRIRSDRDDVDLVIGTGRPVPRHRWVRRCVRSRGGEFTRSLAGEEGPHGVRRPMTQKVQSASMAPHTNSRHE
jgi:hypothetical protein